MKISSKKKGNENALSYYVKKMKNIILTRAMRLQIIMACTISKQNWNNNLTAFYTHPENKKRELFGVMHAYVAQWNTCYSYIITVHPKKERRRSWKKYNVNIH